MRMDAPGPGPAHMHAWARTPPAAQVHGNRFALIASAPLLPLNLTVLALHRLHSAVLDLGVLHFASKRGRLCTRRTTATYTEHTSDEYSHRSAGRTCAPRFGL